MNSNFDRYEAFQELRKQLEIFNAYSHIAAFTALATIDRYPNSEIEAVKRALYAMKSLLNVSIGHMSIDRAGDISAMNFRDTAEVLDVMKLLSDFLRKVAI